jgi:hypothetical protein
MNARVNLEPGPAWSDLFAGHAGAAAEDSPLLVGSGKAGLALIVAHLRARGILPDKMSEILVPSWLGVQVYHQISSHAFPTLTLTPSTHAVLAYHQYGFPQKMKRVREIADDRKLALIEDCAHACATEIDGRSAGTFGDYSVYSYSKFTFCHALGAVRSSVPGFVEFVRQRIAASPVLLRGWINAFKLLDEANRARPTPFAPDCFDTLRTMTYAAYGGSFAPSPRAASLWAHKGPVELAARRRNYGRFIENLASTGLADHLEKDGVVPYAIPLRPPRRAEAALAELSGLGVEAGLYRFDYARNVFEPKFAPCLLLPCHSGLSEEDMERLAGIVRRHHS